jgi:hypothetical protein
MANVRMLAVSVANATDRILTSLILKGKLDARRAQVVSALSRTAKDDFIVVIAAHGTDLHGKTNKPTGLNILNGVSSFAAFTRAP